MLVIVCTTHPSEANFEFMVKIWKYICQIEVFLNVNTMILRNDNFDIHVIEIIILFKCSQEENRKAEVPSKNNICVRTSREQCHAVAASILQFALRSYISKRLVTTCWKYM